MRLPHWLARKVPLGEVRVGVGVVGAAGGGGELEVAGPGLGEGPAGELLDLVVGAAPAVQIAITTQVAPATPEYGAARMGWRLLTLIDMVIVPGFLLVDDPPSTPPRPCGAPRTSTPGRPRPRARLGHHPNCDRARKSGPGDKQDPADKCEHATAADTRGGGCRGLSAKRLCTSWRTRMAAASRSAKIAAELPGWTQAYVIDRGRQGEIERAQHDGAQRRAGSATLRNSQTRRCLTARTTNRL
jgi:hypothetical protein